MKCPLAAFVAMSALWLSACHAEPAPSGAPAADTQASGPAVTSSDPSAAGSTHAPDPTSLLDAKLDKGMAYSEFRKIVLDRGWKPKPDAKCKANVVGGDYKTWCPAHPGDAMCKVCDEVPELSACSGDGHCLMQFTHTDVAKDLAVSTYGEINNWNAPADKSGLMVTGWEYDAPQAH